MLLVVHGMGEHSGRYMNVVDHFLPLGYAVYGLDHLGHGKSDGAREYVERFDDYTDSLTIFYKLVAEWQVDKPIFILGHSMGGLITSYYLLDHQEKFKGAVISAPAVKVGDSISPVTITMSKVLSKLTPKMGLLALDVNGISSDPEVVEAYIKDPLVFHEKPLPAWEQSYYPPCRKSQHKQGRLRCLLLSYREAMTSLLSPPVPRCFMTKPAPKIRLSRSTTGCITKFSTNQNAISSSKM